MVPSGNIDAYLAAAYIMRRVEEREVDRLLWPQYFKRLAKSYCHWAEDC